ncbi:unnamed protein product [Sympodiomycopsis kandeliae]
MPKLVDTSTTQGRSDITSYDADVIIAGAGISGLSAAHHLSERGWKVLVLESRDRTGGRIHSVPVDGSDSQQRWIDLGASYVHGLTDNPLTDLSKKVPFDLHLPDHSNGHSPFAIYPAHSHGVPLSDEKSTRLEYLSHSTTFEKLHDYAQRNVTLPEPEEDQTIWSALNSQPSGSGIWENVSQEEKSEVLRFSTQWSGWTGAQLHHVSLKWWGWEREFPGPDAVVQPRYSKLIEWHIEQSKQNVTIELDHKVDSVELVNEGTAVQVRTPSGETFSAPYFISSLPLGVMQQTPPKFTPPLPPRRTAAIQRLGNGLLNKVLLVYSSSWWTEYVDGKKEYIFLQDDPEKYSPPPRSQLQSSLTTWTKDDAVNHLQFGPLFAQDYTHINGLSAFLFFMGPPLGEIIETVSEETVQSILHTRLVQTLLPSSSSSTPSNPVKTTITKWNTDPHSLGSYSYFPSNDITTNRSGAGPIEMLEVARPLWNERLGFCGEHTEENHFASVHGPLLTGIREGKRVHSLLSHVAQEL